MRRDEGTGPGRHAPWTDLDIDPTSDTRAVRSAYVRKLKMIDVDADPAAFIALRRHFDQAMVLAAHFPAGDAAQTICSPAPAASDAPRRTPTARPVGRAEADGAASFERQTQEILQLLWEAPTTARDDGLRNAVRALLASPLLENIDRAATTERWFATALLETIPQSDPVIAIVSDHYRWHDRADHVGELRGLPSIIRRREDIAYSLRLRQPAHDWHAAYEYLRAPPPSSVTDEEKRTVGNRIAEMLESIRYHHPTIEWELDRDHVARWDRLIREAKAAREAEEKIETGFLENIFGFIPFWGWLLILFAIGLVVSDSPPPR